MKAQALLIIILVLVAGCKNSALVDDLKGDWTLSIENADHDVITTLQINFEDSEAHSCLDGNWKKVVVESYKTKNNEFFPVKEPLSYKFENNKITVGIHNICDAYYEVEGDLIDGSARGEYFTFGWENERLGYFTLKRDRRK